MDRRICITLYRDEVAPRFDLAPEVLILTLDDQGQVLDRKTFVLAHASGDELCDLLLSRDVSAVITGGIEEEYYHYLRWKRLDVLDSVAGSVEDVIKRLQEGRLRAGDVLFPKGG